MFKKLSKLFKPAEAGEPAQLQSLEAENQQLRLDLAEKARQLTLANQALERMQTRMAATSEATSRVQLEQWITGLAAPISQLVTQQYLVEVMGKTVQTRDVLVVLRRLVHSLEDQGITLTGKLGASEPFDPDRHTLLAGIPPLPGEPVQVRFVGLEYRGKLLHKIGVSAQAGPEGGS